MAVYLLHIEPALAHARHYLGWADDARLIERVEAHGTPRGARLPYVAAQRGHELVLVRVWPGATRADERQLKRRKSSPRLCPLCNARLYAMPLPNLYGGAADYPP